MEQKFREYDIRCERSLSRYKALMKSYIDYEGEGEVHHILPRSMWPDEIYNPDNLVKLPYQAHFIAHYLLWRAYRTPSMVRAFQQMCRLKNGRHNQSRLYRSCKEEFAKVNKGRKWWHDPNTGEVKFLKICPDGWIKGNGKDPKEFIPKKLDWWHDPITGRAFRVDPAVGAPPGAVRGRKGFIGGAGMKKMNGAMKALCLIEKKQILVEGGPKWHHIPTSGIKPDERKVLVFRGRKYLSAIGYPPELSSIIDEKSVIPKPHFNMRPEKKVFCQEWQGKTYQEAGVQIYAFKDHDFNENDEVIQ